MRGWDGGASSGRAHRLEFVCQPLHPHPTPAVIKSFQTSGGTVLSTNWSEVEKTDYELKMQAEEDAKRTGGGSAGGGKDGAKRAGGGSGASAGGGPGGK